MRVAYSSLFLLMALVGCKTAPMTNTVVAQVQSPDGKSSALLADRRYDAARVPDEFFLIVIPESQSAERAVAAKHIGDSAALVATWASKVQLRWQSNDALLANCDACGLEAINIAKKLDHVGPTKITYQGFPAHIANE
jgi:hypothetical protein